MCKRSGKSSSQGWSLCFPKGQGLDSRLMLSHPCVKVAGALQLALLCMDLQAVTGRYRVGKGSLRRNQPLLLTPILCRWGGEGWVVSLVPTWVAGLSSQRGLSIVPSRFWTSAQMLVSNSTPKWNQGGFLQKCLLPGLGRGKCKDGWIWNT